MAEVRVRPRRRAARFVRRWRWTLAALAVCWAAVAALAAAGFRWWWVPLLASMRPVAAELVAWWRRG